MAMQPATALMLSKAIHSEHRLDAERRRTRAQHSRRQAAEPAKPRSWPLRVLRLGNAGSRA
jgi:hypothetical protein